MSMNLKFGLAGFGYWGPNLARTIHNSENVDLVAIADSDESNLIRAKENYPKINIFASIEEMLMSCKIDALVVAVPARLHEEGIKLALKYKVHVLAEKPMVIDPQVGSDLLEKFNKENLILMPGHTFIYNQAIIWAKKYIKEGNLGELFNIYTQRLNLGQLRRDVNVVWNLAPHDVSIIDFLLDSRVASVSATGLAITNPKIVDVAFINLKYENGVSAHVHVSWLDPTKTRKITIIGSKGMLILDDTSLEAPIQIHEKYAEKIETTSNDFNPRSYALRSGDVRFPKILFIEPLKSEIEDFRDSIILKREPKVKTVDGVWVAKVLEAVDESISGEGMPVKVRREE